MPPRKLNAPASFRMPAAALAADALSLLRLALAAAMVERNDAASFAPTRNSARYCFLAPMLLSPFHRIGFLCQLVAQLVKVSECLQDGHTHPVIHATASRSRQPHGHGPKQRGYALSSSSK